MVHTLFLTDSPNFNATKYTFYTVIAKNYNYKNFVFLIKEHLIFNQYANIKSEKILKVLLTTANKTGCMVQCRLGSNTLSICIYS